MPFDEIGPAINLVFFSMANNYLYIIIRVGIESVSYCGTFGPLGNIINHAIMK